MASTYNPNMEAGPYAYAQAIAYLSCPSAIRARTLDRWGVAPSLKQCAAYRRNYLASRKPRATVPEPIERDGLDYQVPGLVAKDYVPPADKKEPIDTSPLPKPQPQIASDWRVLVKVVAEHFGMTFADIVGRSRLAAINEARQLCYLLLYERGNSYPQIGRWLGGRDHQPVIHGCKVFHEKAKRSPRLMEAYEHFSAIGGKRR